MGPLGAGDTRLYIEYRLKQVGWHDDPHIADGAFEEIYRCTSGIPRRINSLCSRLLLLGFLDQSHEISAAMVVGVAGELANELGPLANMGMPSARLPGARAGNGPVGHAAANDTWETRFSLLEAKLHRHELVIHRALDIAANYLPEIKE